MQKTNKALLKENEQLRNRLNALLPENKLPEYNGNPLIFPYYDSVTTTFKQRYTVKKDTTVHLTYKDKYGAILTKDTIKTTYIKSEKDTSITRYIDTLKSYTYIAAEIIHASVNKSNNKFIINKGSKNGIEKDMGVISSNGVFGIVSEVLPQYSELIPIIHTDFKPSVRIKKNNYLSYISWDGSNSNSLNLNEIPLNIALTIGDTIVSAGLKNTAFPQGIIVGTVSKIRKDKGIYQSITIKPSTNFKSVQYLYLLIDSKIN